MNSKIIIVVVALVLVAGGGYFFVSQRGTSETMDIDTGSVVEEVVEDVKEKAFTGTLKAAVEMGVPMKCTYKVGGIEYEGLVKGKQYKGKVEMPDGKTGQVIMKENCMYTWTEGEEQGMKLCFTDEEQDMWEETDTEGSIAGAYTCLPAVVTDAAFDLPSDVNFMDLESMMQDLGVE